MLHASLGKYHIVCPLELFGRAARAREEGNYTVGSYSLREEEFLFLANVVYVQNVCFFPVDLLDGRMMKRTGHMAMSR